MPRRTMSAPSCASTPPWPPSSVLCFLCPRSWADKGREIQAELSKYFMVDYDDAGSIGKRYRREDEIGTPYCITVDFQTVGDDKTPADNCSHHPGP